MKWSNQQEQALRAVAAWLADPSGPQVFRLFGYAGTGKTSLAVHLAQDLRNVAFCAYTGKAALMMRRKGCPGAATIHSLIYKTDEDRSTNKPVFTLNPMSLAKFASLIIVDECSMCGAALAKDLLSFGTRVLVLGDPAQLPPVKDAGYFTNHDPDFLLTEIHRQARDNPIIRLSMDVRAGKPLQRGNYGALRVISGQDIDPEDVRAADQVLVGLNMTRQACNANLREMLGFSHSPIPLPTEKLICLRNDRSLNLLNGAMWHVRSCKPYHQWLRFDLESADDEQRLSDVLVHPAFFDGTDADLSWNLRRLSSEFTFGYAITVHKAQGSQWDDVFLFEESGAFREDAQRWLYTGITRAAERITIVLDD